MRVLWVVKGLGPGGAETLLAAAAAAHDRAAFRIECAYVLAHKDHLVARLEADGVRCHWLGGRMVGGTRRGAGGALWVWRLVRLVRRGDFDVVHVHSPLPGAVARLAAATMRHRPAVVSTEHNAWGTFAAPTRWLNRVAGRWNDATVAVSDEVAASVRGAARRRGVRTLVHGIDVARVAAQRDERASVRRELGVDVAGEPIVPLIVTVANFRPQKDHPNLLRAVRHALDAGLRARWVVVGQGPLEAEVRALARDLGVDDVVTFTGFRADATRVMAGGDVFTLASAWEGLPVALMEALALGLPVVATAVGGVAETLTDGHDALLVPPGDPAALADAWARVLGDDALRSRLAAVSAARATEFDASRAEVFYEQLYRDVSARRDGDAPSRRSEVVTSTGATTRPRRALPTGYDIRALTPDDEPAVVSLLGRSLGWDDDPRAVALYRWKHVENPFGASPGWVAVHEGRVVGVRLFMRWEFLRGGTVVRAVRAVDTATDPEHRGAGLFTALTEAAVDQMRAEGVHMVFNTPNARSLPGYLKMGWRTVGRLSTGVRPTAPWSMLTMARSRVPAARWSEPLAVGASIDEWLATDGDAHMPDRELPSPDVRQLATRRSAAFLAWRYGLADLHYRVVPAGDGAAVVRLRRRGASRELVIADLLGDAATMPDGLGRLLRASGASHALALGTARLRHGFVPLPGPLLTWRALADAGMPPLPNWQLCLGDVELF